MTAVTFHPGNLQWVGLAPESTCGTAIDTPTMWIPVTSTQWTPNITTLKDQALRGSMAATFGQQQGQRYDTLTYKTYLYMDSAFTHFVAVLGKTDTVTGTAAPYTHKTCLYNGSGSDAAQPPSYTLFYIDGAGKCWQIPGCVAADLKIDVKTGELPTLDMSWTGLAATAISPPDNTPTTDAPIPAWRAQISVAGTAISKYSEVSIEYKRATEVIPTLNNSQTPLAIYGGELTVTGDLTSVYQGSTDVDLADFLANTQPSLSVELNPVGDDTHGLTLQHTTVAFDSAAPDGTNKWMEIKSKIEALANSTDVVGEGAGLSPALATLVNTSSTTL